MFFLFVSGFAQETVPTFSIKETYHFGAILPHRSEVNEIIEGHTQAYEFSFYKATLGKKPWQQIYNYPKIGISALAINLGNEKELGMGYGIFPFIEIPLNQRKINWRLKFGYGLGYIEKPFDRETNYKNIAIGSHINAIIHGNMLWSIKVIDEVSASVGLSLIHYSNASFSRPNLGINIVSFNAGLSYNFGAKQEVIVNTLENKPHEWNKQIMVGFGVKEIPPVNGPKYFVSSYSFNLIKNRAEKSSFGIGADLFYNASLKDLIALDTSTTRGNFDNFRLGIIGIYAFDIGSVSLMVETGAYAFSTYKGNGMIYNRLSSRFHINDKLFLNVGLVTHFVVADFFEAGIGYKL